MAILSNSAEGGSNGTTATPGNSGGASGSALHFVTTFGGGTCTFDNTRAAHGSLSYKLVPASGAATNIGYGAPTGGAALGATQFAFRFYVYFTANPTTTFTLWRGDDASGVTRLRINYTNAGKLVFDTNNNTANTTRWTSTASVTLNQWVRIEGTVNINATTGTAACAFYPGDSTTATDSYSGTALDTGTNALQQALFGKYGNDTTVAPFWIDDIKIDTASSTFIGPIGNVAPTVDAGTVQNVAAGAAVSLNAVATDSDGSIASYAWTYDYPTSGAPTLTGATTATPTFTAGSVGALYVLRCTVTDNSGATAASTVEVRVPDTGGTSNRPIAANGTGAGTWSIGGGSATDGAALADETDTTYIESATVSGVEQNRRIRLKPTASKATAALKLRLWADSGTANSSVRLYEGSTLRQSWAQALTSTPTEYTFTITSPGAISDWSNLSVELGVTS